MFLQVLISSRRGRSTKLGMEADDRRGDLHSLVGSKSTAARGTWRLKPVRVMELPCSTPPSAVTRPTQPDPMTSLPLNLPLYSPLPYILFSFVCTPLWQVPSLSSSHSCASTLDFIKLPHLISPSSNPIFSSSATVAFPPHLGFPRFLTHPPSTPPAGTIPRDTEKEVSFVTTQVHI